ncbi:MAG TPA: Nif3-like dinuclear metal center hexameric protein, partial [Armatimonadota bacterium]|nr:Nif3-like dinuclear metal center hexameric protein [Armatimonadota bacterium]
MTLPKLLLAAGALLLLASAAHPQPSTLTAGQVLERIRKNVGVPWREQTVDTLKTGTPETPVTGIAVTMMATLDVLQRAAASGKNMVITHEPTFYGHLDGTEELEKESDAVLAAKQALIRRHHLVVFRFHDHWHLRRPDGIQTGMVRALSWQQYQNPSDEHLFTLPETTLERLAADLKQRLHVRTLRVVGDPKLKVTGVGMTPGFP